MERSKHGKRTVWFAINARRKFCGNVSGAYWKSVLSNARIRNIDVSVTQQDISEIYDKQKGKCALTGIPIRLSPFSKDRSSNDASLDRIDNSKGYSKENLRWIHKDVNLMKNHFSDDRFKEVCKLVTKYDAQSVT